MNDMMQEDFVIAYEFFFEGEAIGEHKIHLRPLEATGCVDAAPAWTRLEANKCRHCPLSTSEAPHCPFALALVGPVAMLSKLASYEMVDVIVRWRNREIRQRTTLQRAAGSLLGAIGPTSGCPSTAPLKAMAWFHWPFSSSDETLYRSLGTYLLAQFLKQKHGMAPDWALTGLREVYRNLRLVNLAMAARLRAAAEEDSSVNGLILLDLLAADTLYSLDQYEGELDAFFQEHLQPPAD